MLLFVAGGAVIRASQTGDYLRYVKAGLRPYLIATGVVLMVTAVTTIWYELRKARAAKNAATKSGSGHGGGHAHREPWIAWLLLLPVLALVVVVPPALGSYAADRTGTALQQVSDFPPLPDGDPAKISVLDYASRAVFDEGRSIGTRKVRLTGFVLKGQDGQPYLARMILTCCAADARPVKVGLTGDAPTGLKPDTWLDVTGTYTRKSVKDAINGETIPYLDVSDYQQIPAPNEQYES